MCIIIIIINDNNNHHHQQLQQPSPSSSSSRSRIVDCEASKEDWIDKSSHLPDIWVLLSQYLKGGDRDDDDDGDCDDGGNDFVGDNDDNYGNVNFAFLMTMITIGM